MAQEVKFVVLGRTRGRRSVELIGRYKSGEDLRDVFKLGENGVGRAARRDLYIFEVCRLEDPGCLWLVTFDLKLVRVRDPTRIRNRDRVVEVGGKLYRRPSQEYSDVKEIMFENLCGSIDMSTYICFEDVSNEVESYLLEVTDREFFKIETLYVKPYRDVEKKLIAESISKTISWLEARAINLAHRVETADRRGLGMASKAAKEFVERLQVSRKLLSKAIEKLKALDIDIDILKAVESASERVRNALKLRGLES
jgi:uncharacterized UPF0160 family protein